MFPRSPLWRVAFAAIPSILCALVLWSAYAFVMSDERAEQLGKELNCTAWERSYIERSLAVPASGIETTYFHLLGRGLEAANLPTRIDVFTAGAWKAVQEVRALRLHIAEYRPDLVVLLDGLNDLTVGTTSQALYVEVVETEEGSERPRHARDCPHRIADYLGQVREAAEITRAHGSALLIVLQPSLIERRPPERVRAWAREGHNESLRVGRSPAGQLSPIGHSHQRERAVRCGFRGIKRSPRSFCLDWLDPTEVRSSAV